MINARIASMSLLLTVSTPAPADVGDWIVVTLSRTGAWGIGLSRSQSKARDDAIKGCQAKDPQASDCGSLATVSRDRWILAELCGDERILVTEDTLSAAQDASLRRQIELQLFYVPSLEPCVTVVVVAPDGTVRQPWSAAKRRAPSSSR